MARIKGDKYNRKYCKQLKRGLCKDGMAVEEVCQQWDINPKTWYRWCEIHPEFKEAAEYAKRDRLCYWHKLFRAVASGEVKGNAGTLCFAMKNVEGIGYQDKVEVTSANVEQIKTININVLPAPVPQLEHMTIIEHEDPIDE